MSAFQLGMILIKLFFVLVHIHIRVVHGLADICACAVKAAAYRKAYTFGVAGAVFQSFYPLGEGFFCTAPDYYHKLVAASTVDAVFREYLLQKQRGFFQKQITG